MDHLERSVTDLVESLNREMDGLGQEMRAGFARLDSRMAGLEIRFDSQAAQMDRQLAVLEGRNGKPPN